MWVCETGFGSQSAVPDRALLRAAAVRCPGAGGGTGVMDGMGLMPQKAWRQAWAARQGALVSSWLQPQVSDGLHWSLQVPLPFHLHQKIWFSTFLKPSREHGGFPAVVGGCLSPHLHYFQCKPVSNSMSRVGISSCNLAALSVRQASRLIRSHMICSWHWTVCSFHTLAAFYCA